MFSILSDTLKTALNGSKPKYQRLSYEEWTHRFKPRNLRGGAHDPYRFVPKRDFW